MLRCALCKHAAEKPLPVMELLWDVAEPVGLVVDPFAGAGATVTSTANTNQTVRHDHAPSPEQAGLQRHERQLDAQERAANSLQMWGLVLIMLVMPAPRDTPSTRGQSSG